MPISFIITGIFTGSIAAALAISLDAGAMWALLSYALSGASALLGAALITTVRRNTWPRKGWRAMPTRSGWHARLDQMSRQSGDTPQVGLFTAIRQTRQVRM